MRLHEKLGTLRLSNGDDAREHMKEISWTHAQIRAVGLDIYEVLYKLRLLRSLLSRFENFTMALEAQIYIMYV